MRLVDKGFSFLIASLPEYEKLVVEIYYHQRCVAMISQEDEAEALDLRGSECFKPLPLHYFLAAVDHARSHLRRDQFQLTVPHHELDRRAD